MANTGWIAFLAMLLINQKALGYSTFDPDTTWHEGFGPRHALDLQEKEKQWSINLLSHKINHLEKGKP